jgi:hypothetical protein
MSDTGPANQQPHAPGKRPRRPSGNVHGNGGVKPTPGEAELPRPTVLHVVPPIPDPGDDPPSAYTSSPNFAGMQGIKIKTSILLRNPKNYCRSLLSMAARAGNVTLIDIKRADEIGKQLHLIMPAIANDPELMHDVTGAFEALAIPFIDRHGIPHLWCVRQYSDDGRELSGFASALRAAEFAEAHWTQIRWITNGWEYDQHRNPEKIHAEWPKALKRYDDWLENGFAGRIIRAGDDPILEEARGNR